MARANNARVSSKPVQRACRGRSRDWGDREPASHLVGRTVFPSLCVAKCARGLPTHVAENAHSNSNVLRAHTALDLLEGSTMPAQGRLK